MCIKLNWSVNSLAISESSSRQEFKGILGLSKIKSIYRMSNFKTQEVAEMSKIFHLKLLTEKILELLNATEFVSYFAEKSKKNQEESNNQWWTCDQWDLLPNQHQKMHKEQEETKQSRKDHRRECPLGIEECTEQQHSESIVE